jgi:hypothetical protein
VEEFMKQGSEMLEQDAGGVEEIGLARQQATQLVLELPAMLQVGSWFASAAVAWGTRLRALSALCRATQMLVLT